MDATVNETETKVCRTCFRRRPILEFRRRVRGQEQRQNKCKDCFYAELRERKAARRRGEVYRIETAVLKARTDRQLAIIVSGMVRRLGGEDAFVAHWWECLDRASKEGKSHLSIRGLLTCQKMWLAARRLAPTFSQLPAAERTEIVRAEIAKIIDEHPEAVLWVAATMPDWTVIPPPGVDLGDLAGQEA